MFSIFNTRKQKQRHLRSIEIEAQIQLSKVKADAKASKAAESIAKLNTLVETNGISGIFYEATGAKRRNERAS